MNTKKPGYGKASRILNIYEALSHGQLVNKNNSAAKFEVDEKTIRRDISDIRSYIRNFHFNTKMEVIKGESGEYFLTDSEDRRLSKEEVLVLSKVLLESRAFTVEERDRLLTKLGYMVADDERKTINELISNEKEYYAQPVHKKELFTTIWELSDAVKTARCIELHYERGKDKKEVERTVEPLGIIFSEYYFYLVAKIQGSNHEEPAIFRLDRIQEYKVTDQHCSNPNQRFEEGKWHNAIQFMQPGEPMIIIFRFWGESIEAVLDRLPTAEIVSADERGSIVKAQIMGRGIKMWLLSQAQYLEVLKPDSFRDEIVKTIEEMRGNYK